MDIIYQIAKGRVFAAVVRFQRTHHGVYGVSEGSGVCSLAGKIFKTCNFSGCWNADSHPTAINRLNCLKVSRVINTYIDALSVIHHGFKLVERKYFFNHRKSSAISAIIEQHAREIVDEKIPEGFSGDRLVPIIDFSVFIKVFIQVAVNNTIPVSIFCFSALRVAEIGTAFVQIGFKEISQSRTFQIIRIDLAIQIAIDINIQNSIMVLVFDNQINFTVFI